jgi:hypothetical protein
MKTTISKPPTTLKFSQFMPHTTYRGRRSIVPPLITSTGTSWKRVVNFMPRAALLPGKELPVPSG